MNRLYNLDYLRGIVAFAIMIYHYLTWSNGHFSSDDFMGRIGIYGVSIFYVLSGLTLYFVYINKMNFDKANIISFFRKRIFRILPLLWLVTIISIILSRKTPNFTDLFLNLTGLFGFVRWDKTFSAGVWSIGNELVFYTFFPFFILFIKKYKKLMVVLSLIIFSFFLYFAFVKLNPNIKLSLQRIDYVNPLNQVFLFLCGFLIAHFFQNIKIKNSVTLTFLIITILLFIFYPTTGDTINLITGVNRLFYTFCCLLICLCFYKMTFKLPNFIHKPLTLLGEASYSVYLLHPIVYIIVVGVSKIFKKYIYDLPVYSTLILSILFTLIISYFVYQYFEKYFMKLAHSKKNDLKS